LIKNIYLYKEKTPVEKLKAGVFYCLF